MQRDLAAAARRLADAGAARPDRARARGARRGRRDGPRARQPADARGLRGDLRGAARARGPRGAPRRRGGRADGDRADAGGSCASSSGSRRSRTSTATSARAGSSTRSCYEACGPAAARRRGRAAVLARRALQPPRALDPERFRRFGRPLPRFFEACKAGDPTARARRDPRLDALGGRPRDLGSLPVARHDGEDHAHRGDAARGPARAGVPLGGRRTARRATSSSSPCTPTTASSATASRSARSRARSPSHGELMARQFVGPLGRRRRGDPPLDLDARAAGRRRRSSRSSSSRASSRVLGCARAHARRAVAARSSAARSTSELDSSRSCRATTPRRSPRTRGALPDHEVDLPQVGRPRDDDAVVAAVRDAIGPDQLLRDRPERGVGRGDRGRPHPAARAATTSTGSSSPCPHWDVAGLAHVRRSVDVKIAADQAVYTTPQLRQVLERRGGRRRRAGPARRRRPAAVPPAGVRSARRGGCA